MKKNVLLVVVALLALSLFLAYAQARDKGMWVNRTTGTGVGSVYGVFTGVSKYKNSDLNLQYPRACLRSANRIIRTTDEPPLPQHLQHRPRIDHPAIATEDTSLGTAAGSATIISHF